MMKIIQQELQFQTLVLVQALLGVISSNFRAVWISMDPDVEVTIVLEEMNDEDINEIEELKDEFESLQTKNVDFEFKLEITTSEINYPDVANSNSAIVFMRRK